MALKHPAQKKIRSDEVRRSMPTRQAKNVQLKLRLPRKVVDGLKVRAAEMGVPYQTLVSEGLRQFALGELEFRLVKA